mmetsp:Transcript_124137/g.345543  ORF Transcript_124137/g.345543 Transcript_124137/m.345543 type:complete len:223 (+) Transcript_124137:730-1398(+)
MISHSASKSPSQVSGRLFSSSFSILVILGSMPKWSQNSCTSGSMGPSPTGAAAPAAAAGAGVAPASPGNAFKSKLPTAASIVLDSFVAKGIKAGGSCGVDRPAGSPGAGRPAGSPGTPVTMGGRDGRDAPPTGTVGGGNAGGGPPVIGGPEVLFMTWFTSCRPNSSFSGGPRMDTFRGTPSGNFWSIWMEHPDCSCSFLMVSPPFPMTRPTKLWGHMPVSST